MITFLFPLLYSDEIRSFSRTMPVDYLGYMFGAVVAAGGAMGYVKKRSVPSLVAGLAFGGLVAIGASHVSIASPSLTPVCH